MNTEGLASTAGSDATQAADTALRRATVHPTLNLKPWTRDMIDYSSCINYY